MAFQRVQLDDKDNPAIVFAQESRVKADPNKMSEEVFRLHEGTKIQVLDTYEDWKKIQLSDNSIGWIPSEDIKLLSNF
jgi:SH3-like domain-containing protein